MLDRHFICSATTGINLALPVLQIRKVTFRKMKDPSQWQGWDGIPSLPDSQILNLTRSVHSEATLSHIAVRCDRLD